MTINKHDLYVEKLYERIKGDYDVIEKHVVVRGKRCVKAEIDMIGYKDGRIHIFEVKCSYRVYKASRQLAHIKKLLNLRSASLMFYCGTADQLHTVAV